MSASSGTQLPFTFLSAKSPKLKIHQWIQLLKAYDFLNNICKSNNVVHNQKIKTDEEENVLKRVEQEFCLEDLENVEKLSHILRQKGDELKKVTYAKQVECYNEEIKKKKMVIGITTNDPDFPSVEMIVHNIVMDIFLVERNVYSKEEIDSHKKSWTGYTSLLNKKAHNAALSKNTELFEGHNVPYSSFGFANHVYGENVISDILQKDKLKFDFYVYYMKNIVKDPEFQKDYSCLTLEELNQLKSGESCGIMLLTTSPNNQTPVMMKNVSIPIGSPKIEEKKRAPVPDTKLSHHYVEQEEMDYQDQYSDHNNNNNPDDCHEENQNCMDTEPSSTVTKPGSDMDEDDWIELEQQLVGYFDADQSTVNQYLIGTEAGVEQEMESSSIRLKGDNLEIIKTEKNSSSEKNQEEPTTHQEETIPMDVIQKTHRISPFCLNLQWLAVVTASIGTQYNQRKFASVSYRTTVLPVTVGVFPYGSISSTGSTHEIISMLAFLHELIILWELYGPLAFEIPTMILKNLVCSGSIGYTISKIYLLKTYPTYFKSIDDFSGIEFEDEHCRTDKSTVLVFEPGKLCYSGAKSVESVIENMKKLMPMLRAAKCTTFIKQVEQDIKNSWPRKSTKKLHAKFEKKLNTDYQIFMESRRSSSSSSSSSTQSSNQKTTKNDSTYESGHDGDERLAKRRKT